MSNKFEIIKAKMATIFQEENIKEVSSEVAGVRDRCVNDINGIKFQIDIHNIEYNFNGFNTYGITWYVMNDELDTCQVSYEEFQDVNRLDIPSTVRAIVGAKVFYNVDLTDHEYRFHLDHICDLSDIFDQSHAMVNGFLWTKEQYNGVYRLYDLENKMILTGNYFDYIDTSVGERLTKLFKGIKLSTLRAMVEDMSNLGIEVSVIDHEESDYMYRINELNKTNQIYKDRNVLVYNKLFNKEGDEVKLGDIVIGIGSVDAVIWKREYISNTYTLVDDGSQHNFIHHDYRWMDGGISTPRHLGNIYRSLNQAVAEVREHYNICKMEHAVDKFIRLWHGIEDNNIYAFVTEHDSPSMRTINILSGKIMVHFNGAYNNGNRAVINVIQTDKEYVMEDINEDTVYKLYHDIKKGYLDRKEWISNVSYLRVTTNFERGHYVVSLVNTQTNKNVTATFNIEDYETNYTFLYTLMDEFITEYRNYLENNPESAVYDALVHGLLEVEKNHKEKDHWFTNTMFILEPNTKFAEEVIYTDLDDILDRISQLGNSIQPNWDNIPDFSDED